MNRISTPCRHVLSHRSHCASKCTKITKLLLNTLNDWVFHFLCGNFTFSSPPQHTVWLSTQCLIYTARTPKIFNECYFFFFFFWLIQRIAHASFPFLAPFLIIAFFYINIKLPWFGTVQCHPAKKKVHYSILQYSTICRTYQRMMMFCSGVHPSWNRLIHIRKHTSASLWLVPST